MLAWNVCVSSSVRNDTTSFPFSLTHSCLLTHSQSTSLHPPRKVATERRLCRYIYFALTIFHLHDSSLSPSLILVIQQTKILAINQVEHISLVAHRSKSVYNHYSRLAVFNQNLNLHFAVSFVFFFISFYFFPSFFFFSSFWLILGWDTRFGPQSLNKLSCCLASSTTIIYLFQAH